MVKVKGSQCTKYTLTCIMVMNLLQGKVELSSIFLILELQSDFKELCSCAVPPVWAIR